MKCKYYNCGDERKTAIKYCGAIFIALIEELLAYIYLYVGFSIHLSNFYLQGFMFCVFADVFRFINRIIYFDDSFYSVWWFVWLECDV